jgi:hypothetical protein
LKIDQFVCCLLFAGSSRYDRAVGTLLHIHRT